MDHLFYTTDVPSQSDPTRMPWQWWLQSISWTDTSRCSNFIYAGSPRGSLHCQLVIWTDLATLEADPFFGQMWVDHSPNTKFILLMSLLQHFFLPPVTGWSCETLTIYVQTLVITLLVKTSNSFLRHVVFTRLSFQKPVWILPCLLNNTANLHYCTVRFTQTKRWSEHSFLAYIHTAFFFISCCVLCFVDDFRASAWVLSITLHL